MRYFVLIFLCASSALAAPADTVRVRFIIDDTTALADDTILGNYIEDSLTNLDVQYIVDYRDELDNPFTTDSFDVVVVSYGNGNVTEAAHSWLLDSVVNILTYNRHSSGALKLGNGNVSATNFRSMARVDTSWVNENRNGGWDTVIVFSAVHFVWELTTAGSGAVQKLYVRDSSTWNSSTFHRTNNDTVLILAVDSNALLDDGVTSSKGRYLYDGSLGNAFCSECDQLGASQTLRFLNQVLWCAGDTTHNFTQKKVFEGFNLTHYWAEWGFTGRHETYGNGIPGGVSMRLGYDGNTENNNNFSGVGFWYTHGLSTTLSSLQSDSAWLKIPMSQFANNADNNYGYDFNVELFNLTHTASPFKFFDLKEDPMNTAAQSDTTLVTSRLAINRHAFKGYDTLWNGGNANNSFPLAGTDYETDAFATVHFDSATYGHYELSTDVDTIYKAEAVFSLSRAILDGWKTTNNGFYSYTDSSIADITTCGCDMELILNPSSSVGGKTASRGREGTFTSDDFGTRIVVWAQDSVSSSVDSTPSVNAFNLAYNNDGVLDSADGKVLSDRFDAIVFEVKWTGYASGAMVGYKVNDPTDLMFEYNSFQDNFIGATGVEVEDRYQHDSLVAFLGADSNLAYLMYEDSSLVNQGGFAVPDTQTLPGAANNTDSSLSRVPFGSTSNNEDRRLAWYKKGVVTDAYINFYLTLLDNVVDSVKYNTSDSVYWDGIWHDNVGPGGQSAARSDTALGVSPDGGKVAALNSFKLGGDMGADIYPYYFDSIQLPFLHELMDSLEQFTFANGKRRFLVNNFAEVQADKSLNSGGAFQWHDSMPMGSVGDYAFWENDFKMTKTGAPNLLTDGLASGGTQWTSSQAASYSPIFYWERDSVVYANSGASWWWPRFVDPKPYGVQNWFYSHLAAYYMMRSPVDWIAPNTNTVIKASLIGMADDTLDWCPAYNFNFGDTAEFTTVGSERRPYKMVASVQCLDCVDTVGLGKDELSENWLLFAKDFPNGNKVILRPAHSGTSGWGADSTNYTEVFQLGATFTKLLPDGTQTGNMTEDSLRAGEGAIYIAVAAASTERRAKFQK